MEILSFASGLTQILALGKTKIYHKIDLQTSHFAMFFLIMSMVTNSKSLGLVYKFPRILVICKPSTQTTIAGKGRLPHYYFTNLFSEIKI